MRNLRLGVFLSLSTRLEQLFRNLDRCGWSTSLFGMNQFVV